MTPPGVQPGACAQGRYQVGEADTAASLGSGALPVLGTPRLLAWCEQQTVTAIADSLPAGSSSVGTRVDIEHVRATPVGGAVQVSARLVGLDGRQLRFEVAATDGDGRAVGTGQITRRVVDDERFLSRLARP